MSSADDTASHDSTEDEADGRSAAVPAEPSPASTLVGRRIADRYTMEALLGTGALGRTFRARREADGQAVAIKLLHPAMGEREGVRRRIARDVEAGARLEHLHIAQVFEQGDDPEEGPFVCRELLEARTAARAARDWARADRLRDDLRDLGIEVSDRSDGASEARRTDRR